MVLIWHDDSRRGTTARRGVQVYPDADVPTGRIVVRRSPSGPDSCYTLRHPTVDAERGGVVPHLTTARSSDRGSAGLRQGGPPPLARGRRRVRPPPHPSVRPAGSLWVVHGKKCPPGPNIKPRLGTSSCGQV